MNTFALRIPVTAFVTLSMLASSIRADQLPCESTACPEVQWSLGPNAPASLFAAGIVPYMGRIWLIGGMQGWTCGFQSAVRSYDPDGGTWLNEPSLRRPRDPYAALVVALDGVEYLYLLGGQNGCNSSSSSANFVYQVERFDPYQYQWEDVGLFPHPGSIHHTIHAAAVHGDRVFLLGYKTDDPTTYFTGMLWIYNVRMNSWEVRDLGVNQLLSAGGCQVGSSLYFICHWDPSAYPREINDEIWRLDMETEEFSIVTNLPAGRSQCMLGWGEWLLLAGGYERALAPGSPWSLTSRCEAYNTRTGAYCLLENLPMPKANSVNHPAAVFGDRIFAPTGPVSSGSYFSNVMIIGDLSIIDPDTDGDGVADCSDACVDSDLSVTVSIGECDTGVPNVVLDGGCSISDLIAGCGSAPANHGAFVSCIAELTNSLKGQGVISGREKGAIERCAARADVP